MDSPCSAPSSLDLLRVEEDDSEQRSWLVGKRGRARCPCGGERDGDARRLLGFLLLGLLLLLVIAVLLGIVICHATQRQPLFSLVRHPSICRAKLMGCVGQSWVGGLAPSEPSSPSFSSSSSSSSSSSCTPQSSIQLSMPGQSRTAAEARLPCRVHPGKGMLKVYTGFMLSCM